MAKYSIPKAGGTSKFRLIVIDAELQEGEIGQIAQAIQGAFAGQRPPAVRLNGLAPKSLPSRDSSEGAAEVESPEVIESAEPSVPAPASAKRKVQRRIRTPNLDSELHPGVDPSFKAYAEARNVTSTTSVLTKFLIVAAWLHEERAAMKITAARAFTCFRFIDWPFNIDFEHPLRDLQRRNFLELKPDDKGKGEFSITHFGLDKANKMRIAA